MLNALIEIIELFEWCSDQEVNWEKSALCGLNIDEDKLLSTSTRLHCKVELLPLSWSSLDWLSQESYFLAAHY